MVYRSRLISRLSGYVTVVLALLLWEFGARRADTLFFPTVEAVLGALLSEWTGMAFSEHLVPSVRRWAVGFLIGSLLAVGVGVATGTSRVLYRTLDPVIEFLRAIPSVAIIPVAILFLGFGDQMKIFVIALGVFFPVLLNTASGARNVSPERLDVGRVFQLTEVERMLRIVLPSVLPFVFAGLRVAAAIGLIMVVVSEMVGGTNGIGFYIVFHQRLFNIPEMFGGILLLGILGNALNAFLEWLETRILFWHFQAS